MQTYLDKENDYWVSENGNSWYFGKSLTRAIEKMNNPGRGPDEFTLSAIKSNYGPLTVIGDNNEIAIEDLNVGQKVTLTIEGEWNGDAFVSENEYVWLAKYDLEKAGKYSFSGVKETAADLPIGTIVESDESRYVKLNDGEYPWLHMSKWSNKAEYSNGSIDESFEVIFRP